MGPTNQQLTNLIEVHWLSPRTTACMAYIFTTNNNPRPRRQISDQEVTQDWKKWLYELDKKCLLVYTTPYDHLCTKQHKMGRKETTKYFLWMLIVIQSVYYAQWNLHWLWLAYMHIIIHPDLLFLAGTVSTSSIWCGCLYVQIFWLKSSIIMPQITCVWATCVWATFSELISLDLNLT